MENSKIKEIVENIKCKVCDIPYDEDSINVLREEEYVVVLDLTCKNCGYNSGTVIISKNP